MRTMQPEGSPMGAVERAERCCGVRVVLCCDVMEKGRVSGGEGKELDI